MDLSNSPSWDGFISCNPGRFFFLSSTHGLGANYVSWMGKGSIYIIIMNMLFSGFVDVLSRELRPLDNRSVLPYMGYVWPRIGVVFIHWKYDSLPAMI
jgi:hypothetical protein